MVILGYNFIETLKVLPTFNISRPPWTRSIVTSAGFVCEYSWGTKKIILLNWQLGFCENHQNFYQFHTKLIRYILWKVWSNQVRTFGFFSKLNHLICSTIFWYFSMKRYVATDWSDVNSSLRFPLNRCALTQWCIDSDNSPQIPHCLCLLTCKSLLSREILICENICRISLSNYPFVKSISKDALLARQEQH